MYGMISLRSQAWLPSVITSAPAANSARAMSGARPKPCEAFSALTTARSICRSLAQTRQPGRDSVPAGPADNVTQKKNSQISPRSG